MSNAKHKELAKQFVSHLRNATGAYSLYAVMHDACRAMAIALHQPFVMDEAEHDRYEEEYKAIMDKYGDKAKEFPAALACVADALEDSREDFLGAIMSEIGTTEPGFGQFLTPTCVARMMARVNLPDLKSHKAGDIITVDDPACGASVLLIEAAEEMLGNGVRQGDILIHAEDLESLSFSVSYIQLSLLGYAAKVTRMDSLSRRVIEGPWYTAGYFFHSIPMRTMAEREEKASV